MMLRIEAMLTPTIRESNNLQLHVAFYTCMYFTTVWNREDELKVSVTISAKFVNTCRRVMFWD